MTPDPLRWSIRNRTGPFAYLRHLRPGDDPTTLVCGGAKGWGPQSGWTPPGATLEPEWDEDDCGENLIGRTAKRDRIAESKRPGEGATNTPPSLTAASLQGGRRG